MRIKILKGTLKECEQERGKENEREKHIKIDIK
jgi:hypothetical protein